MESRSEPMITEEPSDAMERAMNRLQKLRGQQRLSSQRYRNKHAEKIRIARRLAYQEKRKTMTAAEREEINRRQRERYHLRKAMMAR